MTSSCQVIVVVMMGSHHIGEEEEDGCVLYNRFHENHSKAFAGVPLPFKPNNRNNRLQGTINYKNDIS